MKTKPRSLLSKVALQSKQRTLPRVLWQFALTHGAKTVQEEGVVVWNGAQAAQLRRNINAAANKKNPKLLA